MAEGKRVAIYARVSTSDQTAENQMLDLQKYRAARGWTDAGEFVDRGFSGAKKDRPDLNRLMDAVRKRQCDCVLVWRYDRFARSLSHLVNTLEYFRERGVEFASYQEGIDTSTAQGQLFFGIVASLAQFERSLIQERIYAGLRRARAEGKTLGPPRRVSESQIAEVKRLRIEKLSIREIARRVGVSKSLVQNLLSIKPIQNVALALDGTTVA